MMKLTDPEEIENFFIQIIQHFNKAYQHRRPELLVFFISSICREFWTEILKNPRRKAIERFSSFGRIIGQVLDVDKLQAAIRENSSSSRPSENLEGRKI